MAGIAFWGGFASGMSKSIERNRDRKMREDEQKTQELQNIKDAQRKDEESVFNLKVKSEKTLFDLQKEKQKIMSSDYKGTEESRIDAINEINGRMFDVYKTANERAASLGKQPIVDISQLDTAQLSTVDVNGEKYVLPQDLAATIVDSNGEMKLVGDEIHQAVYEENSTGTPIPKKDGNGNIVYEPSGIKLRKYSDVFQSSKGSGDFIISELPTSEQDKLIKLGYKPTDSITKAQRNKLVGQSSEGMELALPNGSVIYTEADGTPKLDKYGKKMYKSRSKEEKAMLEKSASMEGILETLDRGFDVVVNNPETVGSLGNNTADWVANNINDILKIPTKTRLEREKLLQFTEPLAAQMRDAVESGVMTDRDLQRYLKMLPQVDDAPESYKSKYKTLRDDLKSKYGNLKQAVMDTGKPETPADKVKSEAVKMPREEAYNTVKSMKPSWSADKINRYLKTKGY